MCSDLVIDEGHTSGEEHHIKPTTDNTYKDTATASTLTASAEENEVTGDKDPKSTAESATRAGSASSAITPKQARQMSISEAYFMETVLGPLVSLITPMRMPTNTVPVANDMTGNSSDSDAHLSSSPTSTGHNSAGGSSNTSTSDPSDNHNDKTHNLQAGPLVRISQERQLVLARSEEPKKPQNNLVLVPGEIRNRIYAGLDFSHGVVCLHCPRSEGASKYERMAKPALTRVCRLLRIETYWLYYATNRFEMTCCWATGTTSCFSAHNGHGLMKHEWLNSVQPFWDNLRDIKFRLPGWSAWTRFQLVPVGDPEDEERALVVTSNEPVGIERAALLQLIIDSYWFADDMMSPSWTSTDLCLVVKDASKIVAQVEAKARLSYQVLRRTPEALVYSWCKRYDGFMPAMSGFPPSQPSYNLSSLMIDPIFVDWKTLVMDLDSLIEETEMKDSIIVRKHSPHLHLQRLRRTLIST